jgi:hypothetical protein
MGQRNAAQCSAAQRSRRPLHHPRLPLPSPYDRSGRCWTLAGRRPAEREPPPPKQKQKLCTHPPTRSPAPCRPPLPPCPPAPLAAQVGEYCGELIPEAEASRRGEAYDQENSSYLLTANQDTVGAGGARGPGLGPGLRRLRGAFGGGWGRGWGRATEPLF